MRARERVLRAYRVWQEESCVGITSQAGFAAKVRGGTTWRICTTVELLTGWGAGGKYRSAAESECDFWEKDGEGVAYYDESE